ncbi:hypothetical protein PG987_004845 [Apiospora arundinis]
MHIDNPASNGTLNHASDNPSAVFKAGLPVVALIVVIILVMFFVTYRSYKSAAGEAARPSDPERGPSSQTGELAKNVSTMTFKDLQRTYGNGMLLPIVDFSAPVWYAISIGETSPQLPSPRTQHWVTDKAKTNDRRGLQRHLFGYH